MPGTTRPGRIITLTVEYSNPTNIDIPSPIVTLDAGDQEFQWQLPGYDLWVTGNQFRFLALSSDGSATILRPGQAETIEIKARTPLQPGSLSITVLSMGATPTDGREDLIDWEEFERDVCPNGMSDEDWLAALANLQMQVGPTWGDYANALRENARRWMNAGIHVYSSRRLFAMEFDEAIGLSTNIVSGFVVDGHSAEPLQGTQIAIWDPNSGDYERTTTRADGDFYFYGVYGGIYDIEISSNIVQLPDQLEVFTGQDLYDVEVIVVDAGYLTGQVYDIGDGLALEEAVIWIANTTDGFSETAVTDQYGYYAFRELAQGSYIVSASKDSYISDRETVDITLGVTAHMDFPMSVGALISGRVADSGNGLPVDGATVLAVGKNSGHLELTRTDTEGIYEVSSLPEDIYSLSFTHPGYVQHDVPDIAIALGQSYSGLDVVLLPGASISGVVTDADGSLFPGALVLAKDADTIVGFAVSDENGFYGVTGLLAGSYSIETRADGYFSSSAAIGPLGQGDAVIGVDLQLQPSVLSGVITDEDGVTPITGAEIELIENSVSVTTVAVTDANGVFSVDLPSLGVHTILAKASGYVDDYSIVDIGQDALAYHLRIRLAPESRITGNVFGPDGKPLADAIVLLKDNDAILVGVETTDDNGAYSLTGLPQGHYSLTVGHEEYGFSVEHVTLPSGSEVVIHMHPATGTLIGKITSQNTGNSISQASVTLVPRPENTGTGMTMSTLSNEFGDYQLSYVPQGDYVLCVRAESYGQKCMSIQIGESSMAQADLALPESNELSGLITDSDSGQPVEGAIIYVYDNTFDTRSTDFKAVSGEDGTFIIDGLSNGQYVLQVSKDDYVGMEQPISVIGNTIQNIALSTDGFSLNGTVLEQTSGLAVRGVLITMGMNGRFILTTSTDEEGRFQLAPLAPGEYSLTVTGPAFVFNMEQQVEITNDTSIMIHLALNNNISFEGINAHHADTSVGVDILDNASVEPMSSTEEDSSACELALSNLKALAEGLFQLYRQYVDQLDEKFPAKEGLEEELEIIKKRMAYGAGEIVKLNNYSEYLDSVEEEFRKRVGHIKLVDTSFTVGGIAWVFIVNPPSGVLATITMLVSKQVLKKIGIGALTTIAIEGQKRLKEGGHEFFKTRSMINSELETLRILQQELSEERGRIEARLQEIQNKIDRLRELKEGAFEAWGKALKDLAKLKNDCDDDGDGDRDDPDTPGENEDSESGYSRTSYTPEDKFGPSGFDPTGTEVGREQRFIRSDGTLGYRIEFWNKEDSVVPTQDAIIIDKLDPDTFDLSTLEFTRIGFLSWDVALPGGQVIDMRIDTRPDMNIAVEVKAGLGMKVPNFANNADIDENMLVWWFHVIDPLTGDWPEDPMAGFLPPYSPETGFEIGWIEFTVDPVQGLPTGTELSNVAYVEFDFAGDIYDHPAPKVDPDVEPAEPAPWINTIDAGLPNSQIEDLPDAVVKPEFMVRWSGEDDIGGSGIASYDIYVSTDGGPFILWKNQTTKTQAIFFGEYDHTYAFYSVAYDNVGHIEVAPPVADTQTYVDTPPTVYIGLEENIDEGDIFTRAGSFVDDDIGDWWTATVDYDDGSGLQPLSLTEKEFALSHLYIDNGYYKMTVTVTDRHGISGSETVKIIVENIPPTLTVEGPGTVDEGAVYTLSLATSDPGDDTISHWEIDWGDGFVETVAGNPSSVDHVYANGPVSYFISASATDEDGTYSAEPLPVTVNNVAPVVSLDPVASIEENGTATLTGTITDSGLLDTFMLQIDWGDPLSPNNEETYSFAASTTGSQTFTLAHQYLDDNPIVTSSDPYTISVTVTDDVAVGQADVMVEVANVAPEITDISCNATLSERSIEGESVSVLASFIDIGILDTHTAQIDWGDGTITSGTVTESGGNGTVTGTHVYATGGIFTVAITLQDDDTGTVLANTTAVIIGVGVVDNQLHIVGTDDADSVSVAVKGGKNPTVVVDADFLGPMAGDFNKNSKLNTREFDAAGITSVLIMLCGGDDLAIVSEQSTLGAIIDGGSGDDKLHGGAGNDILLGGEGDDQITGDGGADILIGGLGSDRLVGGTGDDILVSDQTVYESDESQNKLPEIKGLAGIQSEWLSGKDYFERLDNITGNDPQSDRLNNDFFLGFSLTVWDDGQADKLTGGRGKDWFLFSGDDWAVDIGGDYGDELVY